MKFYDLLFFEIILQPDNIFLLIYIMEIVVFSKIVNRVESEMWKWSIAQ